MHSPRDRRERVECAFVARDLPGFGYRCYRVEFGPRPETYASGYGASISNEFFRVSASEDGTLAVEDLRSARTMRGLNRFTDSGDGGDEYTYCPPTADEVVDRPTGPARVSVTESGPVRWTLEVRQIYSLPARLAEGRDGRSTARVDCELASRVRLYPGVARVEVETEVDNRAEDHRLRVLFPSGVATSHSASEQHFGVIARPVEIPEDRGGPERPVGTYPQKTFTDLSDGESGLMIANRGLPEYEILTEMDGTATFALTLLRCVSWLSRDDLKTRPGHAGPGFETPGAQMPGRSTFEYAIIPHEGEWPAAFSEAHRFAWPLRAIRVTGGSGELPAEGALISIDRSDVIASAIKLAEDDDSLVVRVYNIGHEPEAANVRLRERHTDAAIVDLNEENAAPTVTQGGAVRLSLTPNQIATLKFTT
jgi:alpha-mannosidase